MKIISKSQRKLEVSSEWQGLQRKWFISGGGEKQHIAMEIPH